MKQALNEVRNADVCLLRTVQEAKAHTLKLRADLMGYVSAGLDERRNDPISNPAFRAREGSATYWPYVAYLLYQCVVQTCTGK